MPRTAGFTLLEILVALVVLGFLLVGLHQGTRAGFTLWDAQTRRAAATEELDATQRTLRTLLTGIPILPVSARDVAPSAIALQGNADRVIFVSDLPTGLGTTRFADVAIERKGERLVLTWVAHRHEKPLAPEALTETELLHGTEKLELAYFGAVLPERLPHWHTQWSGPILPLLIRVRVRFAAGDLRRWPDLVAAPQLAAP